MTVLDDVKPGAMIRGVVPGHSVRIVSVDWIGNQAINLVYREPDGGVSETTLYRDDENRLGIEARGRSWSFDGDGNLLRLVTEANRIALAHHFDPYLAIHTSLVDPLPHQISAVYGEMLARQPLRFLLADDPGAGKTIMAGLLIKELRARGDLERCLVVARRKLIVFTEPKDTLHYLHNKIQARLGNPDAVAVIHGGVTREERRKVIERFMQDRDLLVLVANDAAGEGVNLQRGHLMVNYDLPWNPNKIEQRFGRIHRIGQTEVCHLWNLVAADTREGEVYARLLEKLEVAREALGGRVYDVLGELFEGTALKDLLFEAIQYGEREEVKARLFQQVDGARSPRSALGTPDNASALDTSSTARCSLHSEDTRSHPTNVGLGDNLDSPPHERTTRRTPGKSEDNRRPIRGVFQAPPRQHNAVQQSGGQLGSSRNPHQSTGVKGIRTK